MFVGGMDPLREETVPDADNYPETADWSAVQTFRDRAHHRFPVMRRSVFRGRAIGTRSSIAIPNSTAEQTTAIWAAHKPTTSRGMVNDIR